MLDAIQRIKKALDVAVKGHDIETVRGLLHTLVPYVMTEEILRQTGLLYRLSFVLLAHIRCR